MLKQVSLKQLEKQYDLVGHGIVNANVEDLKDYEPEEGWDGLDNYRGFGFILDDKFPFALKHYSGHPKGKMTIYIPYHIDNIEDISSIVKSIVEELRVTLIWQRKNNPEL